MSISHDSPKEVCFPSMSYDLKLKLSCFYLSADSFLSKEMIDRRSNDDADGGYLVTKPLQAAGMSADNFDGREAKLRGKI